MPNINNYNLSGLTDSSNGNVMLNFINVTNQTTNYVAGYALFVMLATVIFLGLKMRGSTNLDSFAATSFFMFIITMLCYPLHIMSGYLLLVSFALVPVSIFLLYTSGGY